MSSNPTSDDATTRDATPAQSADSAAQPVDLGEPDSTPTESLGAQQDSHAGVAEGRTEVLDAQTEVLDGHTEVLNGSESTGTAATEWWTDPAARIDEQHTAVLGEHPTQALHPGEAAYAAAGAPTSGGYPLTDQPGYQTGGHQLPPGTPPPPMHVGGGQGGSPGKPRNSRKTLLVVGLVVALLVAGGLAGGEAYARHKVESCISSQFQAQMGSKIDVSFGWKPLLLTMFDNKVSSVTVDSDDTKFGPAQGMVVHATFNDVEVKDSGKQGGTIGSSTAEVTWSNEGITKTLGGLVSGTTSDPNSGTLSFAVLGGLAQLQVKPKIVGDKIEVDTLQATLLGFGLPTDLVSGIVEVMSESLQSYPMGLQPTKVEVTKDGLHVSLRGGRTELQASTDQNQQQPINC
ncbi:LmeA family phospholipid-binding protein [Nocardia seriolae]|uniref:DUF2993 domain-containing protein n=1 Tax=Nocardia seriolae TaxID=37332 RepID=A0ABC9Z516_9NOCA|nr:DUF2993 domain-containing protein [Nocardia seriolae]WNJ59786.1 DUF2993 domain-containing protein [Nocardia seriolae]BEK92645.1 hypothetical protein NSER024013_05510 [Nocardia seriolae]GAM50937.1 hypothetical protein NS07_v2contig00187-0008 [Nocardia seriolae]GAP32882.1 hypothetical protein NSK11_contig00188-0008 [Nocardia seriolae]